VNGPLEFFFLNKQEGYEESAQHKKEIHAHVAVLKKERHVFERAGMRSANIVEESKVSMVQEHYEK
jgi:hypothetical protein